MRMRSAALAVLFLSLAAVSRADFTRGRQSLALFGGFGGTSSQYDYQPGDRSTVTGAGGAFGAQYFYYLTGSPAIAIGADLTSSLNANAHDDSLLSGYDATARMRSFVGLLTGRLSYPRGLLRPYLFAGIGAHHSRQQLTAQPQSGVAWPGGGTDARVLIDDDETSAAFAGGIGLDIFLRDSFFVGAELRSVWLVGLNTDDNAAIRAAGFRVDEKQGVDQGNVFLRAGVVF